jgi:acylglycerol lipase
VRRAAAASLLLLLAGCAVDGPSAPVAEKIASDPPVVMARWAPPEQPRAVVLALHGFNDRKAAFEDFGKFAAARGVLVEAYDQSGFGARPNRGLWPGADVLAEEAREHVRELHRQYPSVPVYLLGESMGAAVAVVALTGPQAPPIDGLILSAPAVWGGKDLSGLYRAVLTAANLAIPWVTLTGEGLNIQASDNIPGLIRLGRDPLYIRATRVDAIAGLVGLMDEALNRGPELRVRTLVLTGARDEVVPPQSQADFVRSLPGQGCSVVTYLHGWHLLLLDLQRETVFRDILGWMDHEPLPSGLERPCGPAGTPDARVAGPPHDGTLTRGEPGVG